MDMMRLVPEPPKKKAEKKTCKCCGNKGHQPWECHYKDSKCHKCHKVGHLARYAGQRAQINKVVRQNGLDRMLI